VEAAWQAGIVVVVAAGNYGRDNSLGNQGYGTIASPGNDPHVITVGAMNTNGTSWTSDDTVASYSSKGPTLADHIVKPDLMAPGNNVISLLAPNSTLALSYPKTLISNSTYETLGIPGVSGDYFRLSGTSMATPVVSGAAALLIQQHPSLTPDQVKARLMKTAAKALNLYSVGVDALTLQTFNEQSDIFTVGAGYLDINAALANNDLVTLPALSPSAVHNATTHTTVITRGAGTWGDSILWGDSAVFGNIVFSHVAQFSAVLGMDDSILWGDSVIWGQDASVLWGDTVNAASSPSALTAGDGDR
jgi:serine protease AprX